MKGRPAARSLPGAWTLQSGHQRVGQPCKGRQAALAAANPVFSRVQAPVAHPACHTATHSRLALLACHEPPVAAPAGAPGQTRGGQQIAASADTISDLQHVLPYTIMMGLDLRLRSETYPIL